MKSRRYIFAPKRIKRYDDFLDPDFGVRTSLKLASDRKQRNKCHLRTQAESEIPELGLDTGRVKIDCQLNPARMADAAARVARNYGQMRRDRERKRSQPYRSGSKIKRKRTRILIDREYERGREPDHDPGSSSSGNKENDSGNEDDDDDNDNDD